MAAAENRTESRGGHAREDYPERDDENWMKHTLTWADDAAQSVRIDYRPVHTYTLTNEVNYFPPKPRVYWRPRRTRRQLAWPRLGRGRVLGGNAGMRPIRIAIAGAGTAGLAVAAFLARDGHLVQLFERFEEPKPLGAGLLLQPTGLACLARLGLDRIALDHGQVVKSIYGDTSRGVRILQLSYRELGARRVRPRHSSRRAVCFAPRRGRAPRHCAHDRNRNRLQPLHGRRPHPDRSAAQ